MMKCSMLIKMIDWKEVLSGVVVLGIEFLMIWLTLNTIGNLP